MQTGFTAVRHLVQSTQGPHRVQNSNMSICSPSLVSSLLGNLYLSILHTVSLDKGKWEEGTSAIKTGLAGIGRYTSENKLPCRSPLCSSVFLTAALLYPTSTPAFVQWSYNFSHELKVIWFESWTNCIFLKWYTLQGRSIIPYFHQEMRNVAHFRQRLASFIVPYLIFSMTPSCSCICIILTVVLHHPSILDQYVIGSTGCTSGSGVASPASTSRVCPDLFFWCSIFDVLSTLANISPTTQAEPGSVTQLFHSTFGLLSGELFVFLQ